MFRTHFLYTYLLMDIWVASSSWLLHSASPLDLGVQIWLQHLVFSSFGYISRSGIAGLMVFLFLVF